MVKEEKLERDGEIIDELWFWKFAVKLKDVVSVIRCSLSGKMKQRHIKVIVWDRVKVEVNQYDMTQGRITYRYNNYKVEKMDENQ